jgi:hypothetical protein
VGLAHGGAVDDAHAVHRTGREGARMSILESFVDALTGGGVEVVDLTAPLSAETPVIQLPPEFAQSARAQPLRRPRTGLVLEQHPYRRAHRHAPGRAQPLGHRRGR